MNSDTSLIKTARAGDRDKCARLLKEKRTGDVSKRGVGKKISVIAAEGGNLDIVELLLEHGANLNGKNIDNNTLVIVMEALTSDSLKLVELLLLSNGANPNEKNNYCDRPIICIKRRTCECCGAFVI